MHKMNPEKLSNKMESPVMSPYTERRIPSCSVPKSYSLYTNPASDRNNTFPIQDGITYLHPRLARLVVLPTPDFPSDTCIALHNQYSLETKKPNIVKLGGNHYAESNVFQESELRRKSEESELELNHQKTSYPEETQEYDQGPDKKIDETGLLTSLFNVITTRKAQIKHEERKRKLLRRLVTEVYGDGSDQMSTAAHDKSVSSESRNRTYIQGEKEQESHLLDDNLIKSGSLPVDKEVHKSMTKSKSKSKQTQNLQSSHKSRTQSRKSSDNNSYKRSPNSSCGHCSCSSGSRSEKSSPIHEISQKQIGQNKFGYFRDGLQKFRSKFASEKQKSFEKYATPSNLTSVSRSMSSWSESEVSMKSEDSLSSDTTSTVSSPTDETSLSSTTKSSQSVCNSLDSYTSSGDNKLNKLNGDSPVEPVVPKTFRMSLSNVRHSITSLTNALFHPDKSNKRKILQRQSTIKSHESYTYSPRDYWLDALRWFIGPKITNISSTDLMHLLSKKQMTKALARYNKERLTCVFLNETEKSWDYYQLFRSAGCQLIPYDLDVSVTICSVNKPVSVRQQFMKLNQTDRLRNNSALSENGYVLKPALLRIPTINRYHRQLISRNKYQKLFQKSEFNASDKKNQIQNYLRCACCYDPLDISSERELINKIPDGVTCLDWPFSSTTEKYSYLPWNYTIQLINFTKIHKFIGTNLSLLSGQDNPDVHTNQQHIQTPFKLPKRYRKAANATATHQRHASAGPAPLPGTGTNSVHNQTTFVKSKSCFPTSIKHQSHENIHSKNLDNDFQRQHQWSSLKRETVENITVDTEITAPLFKFSHLSTNASSRFCKVPGENDAVSYRLYPNNPTLLTNCKTMNNQHTLGNSKTLSTSSYALLSPMNDGGRMNMCSSFSSMPRSNSELMVESLSTRNVTFSRIHLPESIAIRLNTKICKKEHDAESKCIKITDNKEKVIASCMINTNSPLNKTLTGFQHFQLKPIDHPDRILPLETKCDTTGFNHLVFHQRLKATFGILVFCKVSMNTYVPKSLGDLIETLSKEYDSRSRGRYCRQQTENQQHNANRSKSYVQLKRQESFREKHTIKQPVVRSNSFTYKEYHKKFKKNVV
ncbi:unnamed protein product [Heterobilharzia americana]|nr:unnamed protein product [Heterobilharzia americana]